MIESEKMKRKATQVTMKGITESKVGVAGGAGDTKMITLLNETLIRGAMWPAVFVTGILLENVC